MAGGKRKADEEPEAKRAFRPGSMSWSGLTGNGEAKAVSIGPDKKRKATCLQNVQELNAQFAAWVQKQLKERPSDIWRGGVEDYLRHADQLMADFKDVVDWISTAAADNSTISTQPLWGGFQPRRDLNASKQTSAPSLFVNPSKSSLSWPPPAASGGAPTLFGGGASGGLANGDKAKEDKPDENGGEEGGEQEEEAEEKGPSVVGGEEGVDLVFEAKSKLFELRDKKWKDLGIGSVSVRKDSGKEAKSKGANARIVFRTEGGKVLVNSRIYPQLKVQPAQKGTIMMTLFSSEGAKASDGGESGGSQGRPCMFRTKDVDKLRTAVEDHIPTA